MDNQISILLTLIITTILASYLGDLLGRKIGKKKIKLFNLRPKYTAYILTSLIGLCLAVISFNIINLLLPTSEPKTKFVFIKSNKNTNNLNNKSTTNKNFSKGINNSQYQISNISNVVNNYRPKQKSSKLISKKVHTKKVVNSKFSNSNSNSNSNITLESPILLSAEIPGNQSLNNSEFITTQLLELSQSRLKEIGINENKVLINESDIAQVINLLQNNGNYILSIKVDKNSEKDNGLTINLDLKQNNSTITKDDSNNIAQILDKDRLNSSSLSNDLNTAINLASNNFTDKKINYINVNNLNLKEPKLPDSPVQLVINKEQKILNVKVEPLDKQSINVNKVE